VVFSTNKTDNNITEILLKGFNIFFSATVKKNLQPGKTPQTAKKKSSKLRKKKLSIHVALFHPHKKKWGI
jgi:hypothetical protein